VVILSKDNPSCISFEDFAGSGAHGFVELPSEVSAVLGELDMQWAGKDEIIGDNGEVRRVVGVKRGRGEIVEVRIQLKGIKINSHR
jgi:hypothetical protein